ncbi:phage tail protein [Leptobacterium sp. I13]|uniref:phage tail protein n=1 Tax=Leptobacterium meishanense TaxID=3128904 RepID=UPI0030EDB84D
MKIKSIILIVMLITFSGTFNVSAQDQYIGEIRMFAGNFAPRNWAFCDGRLLPISQYQALYSLLGNTYGGDGRTTFALPDLRGRAPMAPGRGPGLSNRILGEKGGTETNTLSTLQMPPHSHNVNAVSSDGSESVPTNNLLAGSGALDREYSNANPDTTMKSNMISTSGGGQPVNNMQPYSVVNFIIALDGIYPPRN